MRNGTSTGTNQNNPIARDIQNVVSDAQDLLKTVQSEGENRLSEVRSKVQSQLEQARQTLTELQTTVQAGAKQAMDTTDAYVRTNPWRAVGISAGVGALIGFLIARR
jgi:ElaB protein